MRTNAIPPTLTNDADAALYAGWYAAAAPEPLELSCEICGSSEDVAFSGTDGDLAVCLDCAERPSHLWDPYFDAIYGLPD